MRKRNKTYRSVGGFLRAMDDKLSHQRARAEIDGHIPINDAAAVREILNHLFVQVGIAERIGHDESAAAGIARLQQMHTNERAADALRQAERWLKNRFVPISATATSVISD